MTLARARIFLRPAAGGLVPLTEQPYNSEDALQALLADHAELLAGDQIDDEEPRRWLLVGKEVGIPSEEGESDRWSIDHIFLDQDALPTFVEVKRSSDARIRREVVGQLIEYATNAGKYWSPNYLRARAEKEAAARKRSLDKDLAVLLDDEHADAEAFWARAEKNLREGVLRLVFVADKIPPELRRMAEFLNDQMTKTEVLAIEVRQYVGSDGQSVIVPYVLNVTERAREVKAASTGRRRKPWTAEEFLAEVEQRDLSSDDKQILRRAVELLRKLDAEQVLSLEGGNGVTTPTLKAKVGRPNLLVVGGWPSIGLIPYTWGSVSKPVADGAREALSKLLGRADLFEEKEPALLAELKKSDPDLKKLESWLRDFAKKIRAEEPPAIKKIDF